MNAKLYLWLEGIMGEATSPLGTGWIELDSFSLDSPLHDPIHKPGHNLQLTTRMDRSYGYLHHACVSGRPISRGRIGAWSDGKEYLDIKLEEGVVTGLQQSRGGGSSGGRSISWDMSFQNITINRSADPGATAHRGQHYSYHPFKASGGHFPSICAAEGLHVHQVVTAKET